MSVGPRLIRSLFFWIAKRRDIPTVEASFMWEGDVSGVFSDKSNGKAPQLRSRGDSEAPDPQTPYPEWYQLWTGFRIVTGLLHGIGCAWADTCNRARQCPSEYAALIELATFLRFDPQQHAVAHRAHPVLHRRQLRPSAGLSVLPLEDLGAAIVTIAEPYPVRGLCESRFSLGSRPTWYLNRRGLNTDDPRLFGRLDSTATKHPFPFLALHPFLSRPLIFFHDSTSHLVGS
jgi:hypothetical protein